jgi:hypothetical protein
MTPLDRPVRREVQVEGKAYTVMIDAHGLKFTEKGRRNGVVLAWADLANGDAALATALRASLE